MTILRIPEPYSAGILLSYRCTGACRHCMYACSPRWDADWLDEDSAKTILSALSQAMRGKYPDPGEIGVNDGVHFTGGEPFLNFDLLLELTDMAHRLEIPTTFVETNGFWATSDRAARQRLGGLKDAGLDGILISANPFILEYVPFERTKRAARISQEVFDTRNVIVYQPFFYNQFQRLGINGTMRFERYLEVGGHGLRHVELFANGRVPYKLSHLYENYPAERFYGSSCRRELIRDWHVHIDNKCHYIPGYCGGLSLGNARDLEALTSGIDLDRYPVLSALLADLEELLVLGREFGYRERVGYISKCHLCVDIRRHLAAHGDFQELKPEGFYRHLENGAA